MMKVFVASKLHEAGLKLLREKPELEVVVIPNPTPKEFLHQIEDADVLIVRSLPVVDAGVLEHAKRLRVIGRAGLGVDNIDLERATQRGILVVNAPRDNIDSAAEHTWALLLALVRRIPHADDTLKRGRWEKDALMGRELAGKRFGIVGLIRSERFTK